MSTFQTVQKGFSFIALFFLNIFIFFVLLNLALYPFYPIPVYSNPVITSWTDEFRWLDKFSDRELAQIYPGYSREQVETVLRETWLLKSDYEPFIQFAPTPVASRNLNVAEARFRSVGKDQAAWPPSSSNFNVFLFGGSTSFGPGVPDDQTVAAALQRVLAKRTEGGRPVAVYNFAAPAHFSLQERIRFEQLIINGFVPDLAVFLDGLNDFIIINGVPAHTSFFKNANQVLNGFVHRRDLSFNLKVLFDSLPIGVAIKDLSSLFAAPEVLEWQGSFGERIASPALRDPKPIRAAFDRYLANYRQATAVGDAFGVATLFVWQPIPFYKYSMEDRMMDVLGTFPPGHEQAFRPKFAYPLVAERVAEKWPGRNFQWCADLQEDNKTILYVDHVHYSGPMSELIAGCIVDGLAARKIAPFAGH